MSEQVTVEQLQFGTPTGTKLHRNGYTKIRIHISKPLLKYVEDTTRQDQTKSERLCELIAKGMRECQ
jgi:hypothetical protein